MTENRWNMATGRVVSVRLPATVYAIAEVKAKHKGISVGVYLKDVICKGLSRMATVNGNESTTDVQPDPEKLARFKEKYGR